MLRGATQIRKFPWNFPHLRRKAGCAARRFRCGAPYTPARRTSFPGLLQKPFSKAAFSLGSSELPVLLPRRRSLSDRFFVFHHDTPIQIAALQSEDQHFGRGQIGRAGDIVRIAQAERAHDALILPRVGVVRVGEHQNKVNFVLRDARVDLLVAALIFRQEQRDRQPRRL